MKSYWEFLASEVLGATALNKLNAKVTWLGWDGMRFPKIKKTGSRRSSLLNKF